MKLLKKSIYLFSVGVLSLVLFSFKTSNSNEANLNLANVELETSTEFQVSSASAANFTKKKALKDLGKEAIERAKKAWQQSTREAAAKAAVWAVRVATWILFDNDGTGGLPNSAAMNDEISLKLSKL